MEVTDSLRLSDLAYSATSKIWTSSMDGPMINLSSHPWSGKSVLGNKRAFVIHVDQCQKLRNFEMFLI